MYGIFDIHAFQDTVIGVGDQPIDRTDQPLGCVHRVRDCILNRSAARFVFRDHPEIVREVTSAYERKRRAAARRESDVPPPTGNPA